MSDPFTHSVSAGLTGMILTWLAKLIGGARPRALGPGSGEIAPEPVSLIVVLAVGVALAVGGVAALVVGYPPVGAIVLLLGAVFSAAAIPALTGRHKISWSAQGIEGPSRSFGVTLGLTRATIAWSEIHRCAADLGGYWFLESADGRRVYWNYFYKGYWDFVRELKQRRPDLEFPPALLRLCPVA